MISAGAIKFGTRVRIKKGWHEEGSVGKALSTPEIVGGQEWVFVVWDGKEDPDCNKLAALEAYTAETLAEEAKRNLKPCPFCGGEAKLGGASKKLENRNSYLNSWVACTKCETSKVSATHCDGELMSREWQDADAVEKWNKRKAG